MTEFSDRLQTDMVVVESDISISGREIMAGVKCLAERPNIDSILVSKQGKKWRIVDNNLKTRVNKLIEDFEKKEACFVYLFKLSGIDHMERPTIGEILQLHDNVS